MNDLYVEMNYDIIKLFQYYFQTQNMNKKSKSSINYSIISTILGKTKLCNAKDSFSPNVYHAIGLET